MGGDDLGFEADAELGQHLGGVLHSLPVAVRTHDDADAARFGLASSRLFQGRYAEAVTSTGAEAELVDQTIPAVKFTDGTASIMPVAAKSTARALKDKHRAAAPDNKDGAARRRARAASTGGSAVFFDFDSDGDLDLFDAAVDGQQRLYRNDAGKLVDVSAQAGTLTSPIDAVVVAVVAGDYDNDTRPDLFVLSDDGHSRLYHNDGAGKFSDVTAAAGIAASPSFALSAAFVDVDHDGDLDIFIAGYSPLDNLDQGALNVLLRNNGDGKFSDITSVAKVAGTATQHGIAVVPTDYDNRRDVDLFVLDETGQPALYRNLRDGSFRDVAAEVGLATKGRFTGAAAGDWLHASAELLPADTAYVTPARIEFSTAVLSAAEKPPPRLMLATAGFVALRVTQSTPASTLLVVPLPTQSMTRTATRRTFFATPYVVEPTVPAVCVPCPLQSCALPPAVIAS